MFHSIIINNQLLANNVFFSHTLGSYQLKAICNPNYHRTSDPSSDL